MGNEGIWTGICPSGPCRPISPSRLNRMDRGEHCFAIARRVGGGIMSVTVDAWPELPISIDLESQTLGDAGETLYAEINACCDDAQLERLASMIWHVRGQDQLTEAAA